MVGAWIILVLSASRHSAALEEAAPAPPPVPVFPPEFTEPIDPVANQDWLVVAPQKESTVTLLAEEGEDEGEAYLHKARQLSLQKKTVYPIELLAGGWRQGYRKWMPGSQVVETVAGGLRAGSGLDELRFPRGIFLDTTGRLFVADSGNHRVVRWDVGAGASSGVLVAGELGVLYECSLLTLALDTGNNRVQWVVGAATTTIAGDLIRPEAVFTTTDSFVYVADTGQHRVVKYPLAGGSGVVVAGGNGIGTALDQTSSPSAIYVDDSEQVGGVPIRNIYIVDTDNHRVAKVRESDGSTSVAAGGCLENPSYIDPCIEGGVHDPPRPHPDDEDALNPSYDNPPIYHFWGPSGLHVNSGINKNITVADTLNHRVLVWSVEACHIVQESEEKVHQPFCALPEVLADLHELQQATPCASASPVQVGVQYGLCKLVDKCIELIARIPARFETQDFNGLSQAAVVEMAKHDAWNLHEDGIYDVLMRWAGANAGDEEEKRRLSQPFLEHLRYPYMSVEKLKRLSATAEVPTNLVFEALFFKLNCTDVEEERDDCEEGRELRQVPTSRVTVSGDLRESARHTSSNGFTGVRGDRRMMQILLLPKARQP
eukprot:s175_g12.t1